MKSFTVLVATICALSFSLNAQDCKPFNFTLAFESGYSLNHAAIAGFNVGVNFKYFSLKTGLDAHLSNQVNDGLVLRSQIGHTFDAGKFYGTFSVGHAYLYRSSDDKSMNKSEFLINPEVGYKWDFREQPMAFYVSGVKAGDIKLILAGVRTYF